MKEYQLRPIEEEDREKIRQFIRGFWFSEKMVARGQVHYPAEQSGFLIEKGEEIVGLITYLKRETEMEITMLDSRIRSQGLGTKLVEAVVAEAQKQNCSRLWLVTTNDNIRAIHFYQKRRFDLVKLHHDSMKENRKLKPGIPDTGFAGIPIRHELEFEWVKGG
jgi:N-acetylglutamate synthase-like GNAT family acetyltransferase